MVNKPAAQLVAKIVVGLIFVVAAWTLIASVVFLYGTRLIGSFAHPFYQWWTYLLFAPPNPVVAVWLKIGAGVASAVVLVFVVALAFRRRTLGPSLSRRGFSGTPEPMRGATDNHGHADWLPIAKAREIFPGPSPEFGGIVVGEAYRVDQDKVAKVTFDPAKKATWGQGGKRPLLIDPCKSGPTHSLIFAGAGSFKSTSAVSTLLTWTGSVVVLDPSGELGSMLEEARKDMGHNVHHLSLRGAAGFNVLDWIDVDSPLATTNILSVVGWICGDGPTGGAGKDKSSEFFEARGRAMVACLLAHMLWTTDLPAELKTLRTLRKGIATPEKEMKKLLQGIHSDSPSSLARDYAGTLMGLVDETFSGVYSNADESTSWLANSAFAAIVSGDTFKSLDLLDGKVSVFLQIPLGALQSTPAIGRVVVGALLNAAYEADGRVRGRILYLLDEAARLGPMKILETARDAGRKYGITLQLLYQSVGQLERQWGREGKREWYDGVSHRSYAAVQDIETARELEETFGTYAVMATSEGSNTGTAGKALETGSRSRGANTSYHEISRPLIRREELMNDCRTDEAFVVIRGAKPLRCGRAIFFRRPELEAKIAENRFNQSVSAAD
jgi:type IV secretion system protein VirD4